MIGNKKHILMMTVGTSPAVITEMVYSLAKDPNRGAPDEVIVITTKEGEAKIVRDLLESGVWEKMKKDLNISPAFGDANIELIKDEETKRSHDVTTTDGINAMADFLLDRLRSYTDRSDTIISFSIAGGRKSMSAVGGLVMTLLGRKDDKMYHILVNDPFDKPNLQPPFYYPIPGAIHYFNDKPHKSEDAQLQLGEIPFVRCRYWFQEKGIENAGYLTMVNSFNSNQVKIVVDTNKNELLINGEKVQKLSTLSFALYWMFAERHKKGEGIFENGINGMLLHEVFQDFLDDNEFEPIEGRSGKKYGMREYGQNQLESEALTHHGLPELNKALRDFQKDNSLTVDLTLIIERNCWGICKNIRPDDIEII